MTEDKARAWVSSRYGGTAITRLEQICSLICAESTNQNLVAPSTLATMWTRHIVDSAQLLDHAPRGDSEPWIDIGSGAGFPGLVIGVLSNRPVLLVEPRKRRAAFLTHMVETLGLSAVTVECGRVQDVAITAGVISARAVAPLPLLFEWASGCSSAKTCWILPKGRSALEEVATAKQAWHGVFHVEHSITDPDSMIVLASGVKRR